MNKSTKEYLQASGVIFVMGGLGYLGLTGVLWLDQILGDSNPIQTPLELCILGAVIWLYGLVMSFIRGRKKK